MLEVNTCFRLEGDKSVTDALIKTIAPKFNARNCISIRLGNNPLVTGSFLTVLSSSPTIKLVELVGMNGNNIKADDLSFNVIKEFVKATPSVHAVLLREGPTNEKPKKKALAKMDTKRKEIDALLALNRTLVCVGADKLPVLGFCVKCWVEKTYYCGCNECLDIQQCSVCSSSFCIDCDERYNGICDICCDFKCIECTMGTMPCDTCGNEYCEDCKFTQFCEKCSTPFCEDCRWVSFCDHCSTPVCEECGPLRYCVGCEVCYCDDCINVFMCEECEEPFCNDCAITCSKCEAWLCEGCDSTLVCSVCKENLCEGCGDFGFWSFDEDDEPVCGSCMISKVSPKTPPKSPPPLDYNSGISVQSESDASTSTADPDSVPLSDLNITET